MIDEQSWDESKNIHLIASLTPRSIQNFHNLKPRDLMNKLLSMGYQTMTLDGAFLECFYEEGIFLWVEEDVAFLIEIYLYLEELIETPEHYRHYTFLNDGAFCINATSDRKMVEIEFQFCPGLDVANLVINTFTVSEDDYLWWWRSIVHEILKLVSVQ